MISTLYQLDGGWTLQALQHMNGDLFAPLGMDPYRPESWPENPINRILKDDALLERLNTLSGVNGTSLIRAQVICQQAMWHAGYERGPEGDDQPKTLRKLWYAGHKEAIQHISRRLEVWRAGSQMNDTAANGAMSQVYGEFVDTGLITYLDMYVKDGSRKFQVFDHYYRLPSPLSNIIVCIEKDAAYDDCVLIGRGLGAAAAVSGGGKMGKAGTENMVRQALTSYYKHPKPGDLVTPENPAYVLTISDWDYDGEQVIAPTFTEQLKRYVPEDLIRSVRIGIRPVQVEEMGYHPSEKWYQVKYDPNSAYSEWCRRHALFSANGDVFYDLDSLFVRHPDEYPFELSLDELPHRAKRKELPDYVHLFERFSPQGFELDALKRVEYASIIIEGLLQVVEWDTLIEALSKGAWSDDDRVADQIVREILDDNERYIELNEHITDLHAKFEELIEELTEKRRAFEKEVEDTIRPLVEQWNEDERIKDDDPEPTEDDFANHLRRLDIWEHWQPFNKRDRDTCHRAVVSEEEEDTITELKQQAIEFERVEFGTDEDD